MNVSNVSSATRSERASAQTELKQRFHDFKAIAKALRSGDLAGAEQALETFQASASTTQDSQPFNGNTKAVQALETLQTAIGEGDLSAARQAFASFKHSLQGIGHVLRSPHHFQVQLENRIEPDENVASDDDVVPDENVAPGEDVVPDENIVTNPGVDPDGNLLPDETVETPGIVADPGIIPVETLIEEVLTEPVTLDVQA